MGTITLPNFRTTADVTMNTRLKDGGVSIDWAGLTNIKAWLFSDAQKAIAGRCDVSINQADSTKLVCLYSASKPQYLGIQRLIVQAKYMGQTKTYDVPVFNFVSRTAAATGSITIDEPTVDVSIEVTDISSSIIDDALRAVLAATDEAMDAAALATTKAAEAQAASEQAAADHIRAGNDHTQAGADHTQAASDHNTASADHSQAGADHERAESDHGTASTDHSTAEADHTQAASDHSTAAADHTQAGQDHTRAATDHDTAASDHTAAAADHSRAGEDHTTAAADHSQAGTDHTTASEDHTQAQADHAVMAGYDNRLSAVEGDVTELGAQVTDLTTNVDKDFRDLIGNVIADKTVNVSGTNTTDTGVVLKAGEPYLIYVQCSTATTHSNCGVWVRNASNSFTQIKRLTAEEYAQGAYIEYTPVEDVSIWVRPYSTGSVKVTVWDENAPATITEIAESSITDAILSESFQYSNIVSGDDGVTSANILWPDGATGEMAVTYTNGLPSRVTYSHILDGVTRNFEQVVTYSDGDVVSNEINEI